MPTLKAPPTKRLARPTKQSLKRPRRLTFSVPLTPSGIDRAYERLEVAKAQFRPQALRELKAIMETVRLKNRSFSEKEITAVITAEVRAVRAANARK